MSDVLNPKLGGLFVQLTAGKAPEYLSCTDLGAIAAPEGDETLFQCRDANGNFMTVGSSTGVPGAVTVDVTVLVSPEATILDEIKRCYINLYALQRSCGRANQFSGWNRAYTIHHARVTTRTLDNVVKRETADPTTLAMSVSGWHPLYMLREVTVSRPDIAETTALNFVAKCGLERCAGDCGPAQESYTNLFTGGDGPAGSPAALADIWSSDDEGATWSNVTGGAGHPFDAAEDVVAGGCFQIDADTWRWLVVREAVAGEHLTIAYSDDEGATWTEVEVGTIDNEGGAGPGAYFSLDREHIWIASTAGNVYFSDDAGLTWTLEAASTASGGNQINCIQFADDDNGWFVGNSDTVAYSTDGGETWTAVTAPTSGDNLTALACWSEHRALFGTNSDELWQTWDGGVHWTAESFTGQVGTGTVKFLSFCDDLNGFMVQNTVAPVGYVHRTIDGGYTWQRLTTPTNAGLNHVIAANENRGYAVGEPQGGTAVVLKISG